MILNIRAVVAAAALSFASVACTAPAAESEPTEAEETTQDLDSRSAYFETFEGLDEQHYLNFVAVNGANVLRSHAYTTRTGAEAGRDLLLSVGVDARQFDFLETELGEHYFTVKAMNGRLLGTSNFYSTRAHADRGARAVRALVRLARAEAKTVAAPTRESFELFTGEDGDVYFRLRAANGEIMLASQGYSAKTSAKDGIASFRANGSSADRFQVVAASDDQLTIRLVAANGQIIARGESYASKTPAECAIGRLTEILSGTVGNVE